MIAPRGINCSEDNTDWFRFSGGDVTVSTCGGQRKQKQMQFFLPIFDSLNAANIRYLVAGGLATVLHGYQRLTGDIDIILDLDAQNCVRAMEVLKTLQFKPRAPVDIIEFADPIKRDLWIREKGLKVFSLYASVGLPFDIDIFVEEPKPYSALLKNAVPVVVNHITVPIVSIPDLIELKRIAGRPKDLDDIAALEIIQSERGR